MIWSIGLSLLAIGGKDMEGEKDGSLRRKEWDNALVLLHISDERAFLFYLLE